MDLARVDSSRLASSPMVCSTWMAARATLDLKAELCFFLICFMVLLLRLPHFRSGTLS